jgi:hypothetical protein
MSGAWLPMLVLRRRRNKAEAFLYVFDLLELNGTDRRRDLGRTLSTSFVFQNATLTSQIGS